MASTHKRIDWDNYFMYQALLLSQRATCERLKVGAVLVKGNRIVSTGYNGSVSGDEHCTSKGCYLQDGHCVRTIHAEANAIIQCAKLGVSTDDTTIYVTHFPCLQCTKQILQAGVTEICYLNDYRNNEYAEHLYQIKGIKLRKVVVDGGYLHELGAMLEESHQPKTK